MFAMWILLRVKLYLVGLETTFVQFVRSTRMSLTTIVGGTENWRALKEFTAKCIAKLRLFVRCERVLNASTPL